MDSPAPSAVEVEVLVPVTIKYQGRFCAASCPNYSVSTDNCTIFGSLEYENDERCLELSEECSEEDCYCDPEFTDERFLSERLRTEGCLKLTGEVK